MQTLVKERVEHIRKMSLNEKNRKEYKDAVKSIENDEEFIKLYNMTVQKYLDEGRDPSTITFNQIIELDFDYFARSYGARCFIVKSAKGFVTYYEI